MRAANTVRRPVLRVCLTIALIAAPLTLTSCVHLPWGGDEAAEATPITVEADGVPDAADGEAAPVQRAGPLVDRGVHDPMPMLDPAAPGPNGMSEPHAATQPAPVKPTGPADGERIGRRAGRLRADGDGGWVFHFEDDPDAPPPPLAPMTVLPGSILESMERIVAAGVGESVLFGISGEATRYRGRNYLIIRRAVVRTDSPGADPSE